MVDWRLSVELLTALNSKGLRLALLYALPVNYPGITHCPEFKGIKTLHVPAVSPAMNELLTALNSKGLRQQSVVITGNT